MNIECFSPNEWSKYSQDAHLVCFNEIREPSTNRIDFALMATEDTTPLGFITCRETDAHQVYLQYGGAFPSSKGTEKSFQSFMKMMMHLKERGYLRSSMLVENTNLVMLKFAMKAGWLITGVRIFDGSVMLEHQIKFETVGV